MCLFLNQNYYNMDIFKIIPLDVYSHDIIVSIGQSDDDLYKLIEENISKKEFNKYMSKQTSIATTHELVDII